MRRAARGPQGCGTGLAPWRISDRVMIVVATAVAARMVRNQNRRFPSSRNARRSGRRRGREPGRCGRRAEAVRPPAGAGPGPTRLAAHRRDPRPDGLEPPAPEHARAAIQHQHDRRDHRQLSQPEHRSPSPPADPRGGPSRPDGSRARRSPTPGRVDRRLDSTRSAPPSTRGTSATDRIAAQEAIDGDHTAPRAESRGCNARRGFARRGEGRQIGTNRGHGVSTGTTRGGISTTYPNASGMASQWGGGGHSHDPDHRNGLGETRTPTSSRTSAPKTDASAIPPRGRIRDRCRVAETHRRIRPAQVGSHPPCKHLAPPGVARLRSERDLNR